MTKLSTVNEYAIYGMFAKMGKLQKVDRRDTLHLTEGNRKITIAFDNTCGMYFGLIYDTDKGPTKNSKLFFNHDIDSLKTTVTQMAAIATKAVMEYIDKKEAA